MSNPNLTGNEFTADLGLDPAMERSIMSLFMGASGFDGDAEPCGACRVADPVKNGNGI